MTSELTINENKLRNYMKEIIALSPENENRVRELLDLILNELQRITATYQDEFNEIGKRLSELTKFFEKKL